MLLFFFQDVDDALPLVFVDLQGVVPDVDIQDLGTHCPLAAAPRVLGIPGAHDLSQEWESHQEGVHVLILDAQ